jgi:hypothetical protein
MKIEPKKESLDMLQCQEYGEHYQYYTLVEAILYLCKEIDELKAKVDILREKRGKHD